MFCSLFPIRVTLTSMDGMFQVDRWRRRSGCELAYLALGCSQSCTHGRSMSIAVGDGGHLDPGGSGAYER